MGGIAKIKLSCCLLTSVFGHEFWKDLGLVLEAFLAFNWHSEATWKASVTKYANEEGS